MSETTSNAGSVFSALYEEEQNKREEDSALAALVFGTSKDKKDDDGGGGGGGGGGIKGINSKSGNIKDSFKDMTPRPNLGQHFSGSKINNIAKVSYVPKGKDSGRHIAAYCIYIQERERGLDEKDRQFFNRDRNDIPRDEVVKDLLERRGEYASMFKIILSPKQNELNHEQYLREIMERWEKETGIRTDWVAIKHENTAYHHVHICMPGVTEDGRSFRLDKEQLDLFREIANEHQYELQMRDYNLDKMIDKEFERENREDLERLLEHFEQVREHNTFMRDEMGYTGYGKDARDILGPEYIFDYLGFMRELNNEIMEKEYAQREASARDSDKEKTDEKDASDKERSDHEQTDRDVGQSLYDLQTSRDNDKDVEKPDRDNGDRADEKDAPPRSRDDIPTNLSALQSRESPELALENDLTRDDMAAELRDSQRDHDRDASHERDQDHEERDREAAGLYTLTASAAAETSYAGQEKDIDPRDYLYESQMQAHQDMVEHTEIEMSFPAYEDTTVTESGDGGTPERDDDREQDLEDDEREKDDDER